MSDDPEPLIPKHGGYENTVTWKIADLIYDITVLFCDKYLDRRDRTHDQMVQSARSGCQNLQDAAWIRRYPRRSNSSSPVYHIKRQMDAQAKDFEENGGFTERLYRVRQHRRRLS